MTILIGGAWPYANGSLHLGHIAGLLAGDILARYFRLKGEEVLYVSGSDCHGTPIAIRAKQEKVSPEAIADRYHGEFAESFEKLGFSYDIYTRTDHQCHHDTVKDTFLKLLENGYIYSRAVDQNYCPSCAQFLPDRYIEGICPRCGKIARGDQCDHCSALLDPDELWDKKCRLCGRKPELKKTEHLYFALSKLQKQLEDFLEQSEGWRENAVNLTRRYLNEGLQDRTATRDLPWGIDVPLEGYEGKKIYVWIEAVCGYLSASKQWGIETGQDWKRFWGNEVTAYYIHGKDNIPFHSLILPGLLLGSGGLHLPDRIISSEYLTIEGQKLSTSRNWAVWVPDILRKYNPDSFRYYLTINGPEKRDADFSWRELVHRHNGELVGAFGNFVNRSLVFIHKYYEGKVPLSSIDESICGQIKSLYGVVGDKIERGCFKSAIEDIFEFIRRANKYFDDEKPWIKVRENPQACSAAIYTCVQIIANLSVLLSPFIPHTCHKIQCILNLQGREWAYVEVKPSSRLSQPQILFERLDKSIIELETASLGRV